MVDTLPSKQNVLSSNSTCQKEEEEEQNREREREREERKRKEGKLVTAGSCIVQIFREAAGQDGRVRAFTN
jgi:hypothetical protein